MTEVLGIPLTSNSRPYYQPSRLSDHPTRDASMNEFMEKDPTVHSSSALNTPHAEHQERISLPSPAISLPPPPASDSSFSTTASDESCSTSTDSSVTSDVTEDTDITFPNYDGDYGAPSCPLEDGNESGDDVHGSITDTNFSDSPLPTPAVADDTAIRYEPSRQVDFLSHDWREEDIWSSWRHIVSQRKTVYGERSRLENASWRTWAKAKFDLRTVAPERLNWLKESDVTWLYGPLKVANSYPISEAYGSRCESQISKNNSFIHKKPILKKRSMSEVMLQKSRSTSSLVKQAAASVQAQGQQSRRSGTGGVDSKLQSETPSRDQVDYFTSRSTSSVGTPCEPQERRHIRFDDRVEQCIAIDCKDVTIDEGDESDEEGEGLDSVLGSDSSSDEGIVMMRRKKRVGSKKSGANRSNSAHGRRIIETLPSTTLKYRTDSPDVTQEVQHHTFGRSWNSAKLSPSPSQETLRPTNPSHNFLLPDDDEEGDDDEVDSDSSWSFGASNPKSSLGAAINTSSSRKDGSASYRYKSSPTATRDNAFEIEGMRRTGSGMFMPLDEDEDDIVATGLFGRVSETINTARDIAHVIWNVGWKA